MVDVKIDKIRLLVEDLLNDFDFYEDPATTGAYQGAACLVKSNLTTTEKYGLSWILNHHKIITIIDIIEDYLVQIKADLVESGEVK